MKKSITSLIDSKVNLVEPPKSIKRKGEYWANLKLNCDEKYIISTQSRIFNLTTKKLVNLWVGGGSYQFHYIPNNKKSPIPRFESDRIYNKPIKPVPFKKIMVQKLIALTFLKKPSPLHNTVIHLNFDNYDNGIENLQWAKTNRKKKGIKKGSSIKNAFIDKDYDKRTPYSTLKLDPNKVRKIRIIMTLKDEEIENKNLFTQKEIGEMFNVTTSVISSIKRKTIWAHVDKDSPNPKISKHEVNKVITEMKFNKSKQNIEKTGRPSIPDSVKKQILKLSKKNYTIKKISEETGVSISTVCRVKSKD